MNNLKPKAIVRTKDYAVSKQNFELHYDEKMDMFVTFPKPSENELPKFYESENYISHTDANKSLTQKTYQFIKKIALRNKITLINQYHPQKGTILDIGAGTGEFLLKAKTNGWTVTGIEPNEKAAQIAKKKDIEFVENTKKINSCTFDVITLWHVLEHLPDLNFQLKELKRLLKPNGTIIVAVPNFNSYDAKHYGVFWAAYDVPRHLWHFSKTAIKKLFQKEGMYLNKVLPMKFDAFYVSLLSEKYKNGYSNPFKAFLIGLKSNFKAKKFLEYSSHIYVIKNIETNGKDVK